MPRPAVPAPDSDATPAHRATQVVLLCGGSGLRLRTDLDDTAKPLQRLVDGRPLLLHVMDVYRRHGFAHFVLCLGYGAGQVRDFLLETWAALPMRISVGPDGTSLSTAGPAGGGTDRRLSVTLLDTGLDTSKASRLLQARDTIIGDDFLFGYADVLSNLDLGQMYGYHRDGHATVTVAGTVPRSRFGHIQTTDGRLVTGFLEKPRLDTIVSAGFFVADRRLFAYLDADVDLEREVLPALAADKEVQVFLHDGFWLPADTYKDLRELDELMKQGRAPWLSTT
jgi:glucose-1-phosphate cytidylyltransferase